jgi:hypothetical protein
MSAPLDLVQVRQTVRGYLLNVEMKMLDQNGNPIIVKPDPNGNMGFIADAIGDAIFDILKNQVLIQVHGGQPVQVNTGTGTGSTLPFGTGTVE